MHSIPVLSPAQSADWDARATREGIALATLMESAGRAVADLVTQEFPQQVRQGVLIAAGTGHNGGDGWVVARVLHRLEVPVWVAALPGETADLTSQVRALARSAGVREVAPDGPWPGAGLVVDALLGTGARGAPRPPVQALLDRLLDLRVPVVAVDGPTGVDLETGVMHGTPHADLTVTFGGFRRGHLLARDESGDVVVVDIGHPSGDAQWSRLVTDAGAAAWLPPFRTNEHKGTRGRVVVLGGDAGMSGAARLAGRAAFAAGAGLVHVAASPDAVEAIRAAEPDLQTAVQPLNGKLTPEVHDLLSRADVAVIGPGLGRGDGRTDLVCEAIRTSRRIVLDADGLVAMTGRVKELRDVVREAPERVCALTPHPGEFRALFPELASQRETDPWGAATAGAELSGCTVLLKGVPTVVAADSRASLTVAAGNPGLATGGSGDVLSGIAAAILARQPDAQAALACAAHALGRAADLAARRVTARAMRPMDVITALSDLWREWDLLTRVGSPPRPPVLYRLPRPQLT